MSVECSTMGVFKWNQEKEESCFFDLWLKSKKNVGLEISEEETVAVNRLNVWESLRTLYEKYIDGKSLRTLQKTYNMAEYHNQCHLAVPPKFFIISAIWLLPGSAEALDCSDCSSQSVLMPTGCSFRQTATNYRKTRYPNPGFVPRSMRLSGCFSCCQQRNDNIRYMAGDFNFAEFILFSFSYSGCNFSSLDVRIWPYNCLNGHSFSCWHCYVLGQT